MTPEKLFHELLGLGLKWEVVESRFDRESGTVFLEIRETSRLWESVHCPKDKGTGTYYDHTEVLTWRHLNIFQHRCEITCWLPRGKRKQCGHVFRVHLLSRLSPVHSVHLLVKMLPEQRAWRKFACLPRQSRVPDVRMRPLFRGRGGGAGLRRINQHLLAPLVAAYAWRGIRPPARRVNR